MYTRVSGRLLAPIIAAATLLAIGGFCASLGYARTPPRAHAAHAVSVNDTAHLHYIEEEGSILIENGTATGGFPGRVTANFDIGSSVSVLFTVYVSGGTVTGHGVGALHSSGHWASFGGTMSVVRGTGRYKHASGHGGFYGTLNRSNYASVIQTTGTMHY
jgi:hypothetical protein